MDTRASRWTDEAAEREADRVSLTRRANGAAARWVQRLWRWSLFATLTYDRGGAAGHRPLGRVSVSKAKRDAARLLDALGRRLGRQIHAVFAIELDSSHSAHLHGLLDLSASEAQTLSAIWFRAHGYARVEMPNSITDVARYTTKHFGDELADFRLQ